MNLAYFIAVPILLAFACATTFSWFFPLFILDRPYNRKAGRLELGPAMADWCLLACGCIPIFWLLGACQGDSEARKKWAEDATLRRCFFASMALWVALLSVWVSMTAAS